MILQLAARNVFRHKARSLITISTIIFGCVALMFVGGFFDNALVQMRESYILAHTGHLQVSLKGFLDHGKVNPYGYLIENDREIKDLIRTLPEVKSVTSKIQFAGLLSTGDNTVSFIGQGVEPESENERVVPHSSVLLQDKRHFLAVLHVQGEGLALTDQKKITVGIGLATSLGVKAQEQVTMLTNTVAGGTNAMDVTVKGIFRTSAKNYDDFFAQMPLRTAQKLLGTTGVQNIVVLLKNTDQTEAAQEHLNALFKAKGYDLEIKSWKELTDFYTKTSNLFNAFHLIMRMVTTIVVILGIFNTMNMAMMERISEVGTMMAIGSTRQRIMALFTCEGLLIGCLGGILGLMVGVIILKIVGFVGIPMPPPPGSMVSWYAFPTVVPGVMLTTFCLALVMGGLSALFPAYKASRLVIVEALRYR